MALTPCYECGVEMSTAAAACPKCGAPNKSTQPQDAKPAKPAAKTRPVFKVLAVILVALFVFAKIATNNDQSEKVSDQEGPAVLVDAVDLSAAYKANEVAADMKYKGKRLLVTATVESINKDFKDEVWVGLKTDNQFMPIHAEGFSPEQVANLKKGSQIEIACTGAGMTVGSPFLKNCQPPDGSKS
jgi:uncharacterized membrane protein YvbJ